jgi:hypothetical protein
VSSSRESIVAPPFLQPSKQAVKPRASDKQQLREQGAEGNPPATDASMLE